MPDWSFRLLRVLGWLAAGFLTSLAIAWGACIVHGKTGWRRAAFHEGRSAQRFCGPNAGGRPDRFGSGGDAVWAGPYFDRFTRLGDRTSTASAAGFTPDSMQIAEYGNLGWGVRTTQVGCYYLADPGRMDPEAPWTGDWTQIPPGFDLEVLEIEAGWPMAGWSTLMELSGNPSRYSASAPMDTRTIGDAGTLFRKTGRRNLASDVWPTPSGIPLPFLPRWPGAAVNTLVFTGAWFTGPAVLRTLRGALRRRRGLCPRCGYPAAGLAACPECGRPGSSR